MIKLRYSLILGLMMMVGVVVNNSYSQTGEEQDDRRKIYFDAVCFRSDSLNSGRVDAFVLIPYESVRFEKSGTIFVSQYEQVITITDSTGKKVSEKHNTRKISAPDYAVAQGKNGEFDFSQTVFRLAPGRYNIQVEIKDHLSSKSFSQSRMITVINFGDFPFTLSGLMIVSSIEEQNGKLTITPHVSDNVADLTDGFFVFFESYNSGTEQKAKMVHILYAADGREIYRSDQSEKEIDGARRQQYLKIRLPKSVEAGKYTLRVIALKQGSPSNFTENDYLAVSERSIKIEFSVLGRVFQNLKLAIDQLKYVADPDQIKFIDIAPTDEEKRKRFDMFWQELDPTPGTERNEAFEQYYSRIDIADKQFRVFSQGWQSDMGMVFIVFGYPTNIERYRSNDGRTYERWTYASNRQFVFVDFNGIGDYRLYSPMTVVEKYRYSR